MQHASDAFDAGLSGATGAARAPEHDMVEVARYLVPMEANLVCGCLVAAGVPAVLADANLVQTDLPQSLLPYLADLALKAKEQPVNTIELTPEGGIDEYDPDWAYIQQLVQQTLHPPTETPAP